MKPGPVLEPAKITRMVRLYQMGVPSSRLANIYDVSRRTVLRYVRMRGKSVRGRGEYERHRVCRQ